MSRAARPALSLFLLPDLCAPSCPQVTRQTALVDLEPSERRSCAMRDQSALRPSYPRLRMGRECAHPHGRNRPSLVRSRIAKPVALPEPLAAAEAIRFEGFRNAAARRHHNHPRHQQPPCSSFASNGAITPSAHPFRLLPISCVDYVRALTHAYGMLVAIAAPDAVVRSALAESRSNPEFRRLRSWCSGLAAKTHTRAGCCPEGVSDRIVRMQDEAFDGFGAIVECRSWAQAEPAQSARQASARDLPGRPIS